MSYLFSRNLRVPSYAPPDPLCRNAALDFAIYGGRPLALPPRASRRSDLPDVDLSRIVYVPRVSFWGRFAEALGLLSPRYALAPEEWRIAPVAKRCDGAPAGVREMKSAAPDRAA